MRSNYVISAANVQPFSFLFIYDGTNTKWKSIFIVDFITNPILPPDLENLLL
ncbi:MAG: hypothetical protein JWP69_393 [Flaviaesturariibacter sp.]|nr:hypothetical protein [Flaviaesturariibacter sp.]